MLRALSSLSLALLTTLLSTSCDPDPGEQDLREDTLAVAALRSAPGLAFDAGSGRSVEVLDAAFVGCKEVRRGPVCVIDEAGELRLWLPVLEPRDVVIRLDRKAINLIPETAEDGLLWRLNIEGDARSLTAAATTVSGPARFRLALERDTASDDADANVSEARQKLEKAQEFIARQVYNREIASQHVAGLLALLPELDGRDRAYALGRLARLQYRLGKPEETLKLYERSTELADELGLDSMLSEDALAAAFITMNVRPDLVAARRWMDLQASADDPGSAAYGSYFRGLLEWRRGDYEEALRLFRTATYQARRLGLETDERHALQGWGLVLGRLGRHEEARERLRQAVEMAEANNTSACERAGLLTNIAVSIMRSRDAGVAGADDPRPLLEEILDLNTREDACKNAEGESRVRLTLAHEALQSGDIARAREFLESVDDSLADRSERRRRLSLLAHMALLEDRPRLALERWESVAALAKKDEERLLQWDVDFGRARAYEAVGDHERALAAYARAEASLDEQLLDVAFDQGREHFALDHHRSARHYIDLLVRLGRDEQAFCAARRARARTTYPIDRAGRLFALSSRERAEWDELVARYRAERRRINAARRDDWALSREELVRVQARRRVEERRVREIQGRALDLLASARKAPVQCEDLRPPEPGEVVLLYHPTTSGWVGFAADGSGDIAVTRLEATPDPEAPQDLAELQRLLLQPFAESIAAAERVRVLPLGPLLDVPFHALPWTPSADDGTQGDRILLDHAPVAYAVDLPRVGEVRDSPDNIDRDERTKETGRAPMRAVVLADPRGNLEHVLAEVGEVDSLLDDRGWSVELLYGASAGAESDSMRAAISSADHLHYAGHGLSDGLAGSTSFLALADGPLDVGDILILPHVPSTVVLAGCQTGMTNTRTLEGGMSVARAFLAAGSESVIAASRDIDDELAAAISTELYADPNTSQNEHTPGFDGPAALQRAQIALRDRGSPDGEADWTVLRAWVP